MDRTQIASLALKVAGIYILATAISFIPSTLVLIAAGDSLQFDPASVRAARTIVVIPVVVLVILGVVLLALNRTITWAILRPSDEESAPGDSVAHEGSDPPEAGGAPGELGTAGSATQQVQALVFILLGIYLIVRSAPNLLGSLIEMMTVPRQNEAPLLRPNLVGNVLVCALGFILIRTRGVWSDMVSRLAATRPMKDDDNAAVDTVRDGAPPRDSVSPDDSASTRASTRESDDER